MPSSGLSCPKGKSPKGKLLHSSVAYHSPSFFKVFSFMFIQTSFSQASHTVISMAPTSPSKALSPAVLQFSLMNEQVSGQPLGLTGRQIARDPPGKTEGWETFP